MTEASTFAGEEVFGSLRREMTLRRMVLRERNDCEFQGEETVPNVLCGVPAFAGEFAA